MFVSSSWSSRHKTFFPQPLSKGSNIKWSQVTKTDRKQYLHFVVLWKSLHVVSPFTTLWQRLKKNFHMPWRCTRKGERFSHLNSFPQIINMLKDLRIISSILKKKWKIENLSIFWAILLPLDIGYRIFFICHDVLHRKANILVMYILFQRLFIRS